MLYSWRPKRQSDQNENPQKVRYQAPQEGGWQAAQDGGGEKNEQDDGCEEDPQEARPNSGH